MDGDIGICGRTEEIQKLREFIREHTKSKTSGVLYLTGPPGTGKTMSVQYVLDREKSISKIDLNCAKSQSSKKILQTICNGVGLNKFVNSSETEMIERLTKKFSSRLSDPYLIVLDEMDRLPKSKSENLFNKIFSWPNEPNSKLIIIGIANTFNLSSRYQSANKSSSSKSYDKIVFTPYSTQQLMEILTWYLKNDENFGDSEVDSSALKLISTRFAKENGDIRGALNALKTSLDHSSMENVKPSSKAIQNLKDKSIYPTPPESPPLTPRKNITNIDSVVSSIKKRSKRSLYELDLAPYQHEILLACIYKLCLKSSDRSTRAQDCMALAEEVMLQMNIKLACDEMRSILDNLSSQGMIQLKRGARCFKIALMASESEILAQIKNKDQIFRSLETHIK